MIRTMCVGTAGLLMFAGAVAAQPLSVIPTDFSIGWETTGPASTAADAATSAEASDQQPASTFEELRLRLQPGDTVHVVDASGHETRGRVATLSELALMLTVDGERREFAAAVVKQIDRRRRDSVRNGLLIGVGTGALLGFGLGRSVDSPNCPRSGIECGQGALIGTVGGAFWGGVSGWITDLLIRKREIVFLAAAPRP